MTEAEQNVDTEDSTMDNSNDLNEKTQSSVHEQNISELDLEKLETQLEDAQQQAGDYQDKMLRMQAEMENLRKRTEKQVEDAHKFSIEKFANELLQVKDSLELGLTASEGEEIDVAKLQEGTELTLKMLSSAFEKFSIEEVNPIGEIFDPNLHEAMTMQESVEQPPNTVLAVMQKGYTLHGRLIRPAMVIVAKAPNK